MNKSLLSIFCWNAVGVEKSHWRELQRQGINRWSSLQAARPTGKGTSSSSLKTSAAELVEPIFDGSKTTSIAHSLWRQVVNPGDIVVDATCGNGNDTLALVRLVCDDILTGWVYGLDLQEEALQSTRLLLERECSPDMRKQVKLFHVCHSRLGEILQDVQVKLVVFNLGYLPGGNKCLKTDLATTLAALRAATGVLQPHGLISIIAYIGHPGGREEYVAVKDFASKLSAADWVCSHYERLNRPLESRMVLLWKK